MCIFNIRLKIMNKVIFLLFLFCGASLFAQKDSLQIGDRYADDQLYAIISYNQMYDQPSGIFRSGFSYGFSAGFMKDVILNKEGTISFAVGAGYGFDFYNHELKVEEFNRVTIYSEDYTLSSNTFFSHNIEVPFEFRWRTSTANKYQFWRIYTGVKLLYNFSNRFVFVDANDLSTSFSNISGFNKLQYGLTLSAGYDAFNFHFFYGLSPMYSDGNIAGETIQTKALKFGLVFYFL